MREKRRSLSSFWREKRERERKRTKTMCKILHFFYFAMIDAIASTPMFT